MTRAFYFLMLGSLSLMAFKEIKYLVFLVHIQQISKYQTKQITLFTFKKVNIIMELTVEKSNSIFIGSQIVSILGIAAISTITFPLEMVRTRLQTAPQLVRQGSLKTTYNNTSQCIKRIHFQQGFKAFWKGNLANVLRVIPNEAFNFLMKQSIQIWAKKHKFASDNNPSLNFISGSVGAIFTLIFIYPMDFARARLTNDISGKNSIRSYIINTFRLEGFRGIYRGSINFFVSAAIFRAFYFGIFDTFKKMDPTNLNYRLVGSYIGSMIAIYSVYPFDTIRKRMMMTSGANYKYGGFIDCCIKLFQNQGIRSFYRGWPLSLGQGLGAAGCLVLFDKIGTDVKKKSGI